MLSVIIVDDEDHGRQVIKQLIENYFKELQVVACCWDIIQAEKAIQEFSPDIVFLDIEMPGGSGFDLLQKLEDINFALVFITAHEEFALKALKISAVDYILKPADHTEMDVAVTKSRDFLKYRQQFQSNLKTAIRNHNAESQDRKFVINKYKGEEIALKNIVFVEADTNYSIIHGQNKSYTVSKTLKEVEEMLCDSSNAMVRIHKSYIINMDFLESIPKNSIKNLVTLKGGLQLEVSKRKWVILKELFRKKTCFND